MHLFLIMDSSGQKICMPHSLRILRVRRSTLRLAATFIRQGMSSYGKALSQSLENIDEVVAMYALLNRIRLFASRNVLESAEAFVKKMVVKYGEKNMTIAQIESVALEQHVDPLSDFSLKCRSELREIYAHGSRRSK